MEWRFVWSRGDSRYGDVHYYNDGANLLLDSSFPTPRCATEYGVQSLPLRYAILSGTRSSMNTLHLSK